MEFLDKIKAEMKRLYAAGEAKFSAIQSPAAKIAVAVFIALLALMIVWAVLPWVGFIIVIVVLAVVAHGFLPKNPNP